MEVRPSQDPHTLTSLPYDLLLAISQHLAYQDVLSLTQSCRSMREFIASRPVYRHLAQTFLRRCRPLPLTGFSRLSDLSNDTLISAIHRAARLERGWTTRTPQPTQALKPAPERRWYRTLRSPPDEEVDWLSPITSSYILCSTKSGKVFCWDIETDRCLASWDPQAQWELWKCRVEFEAREVYFTMAMVLDGSTTYENRRMQFVVMRLHFPLLAPGVDTPPRPEFSALASFNTYGAVMNVFLLDPTERVLSAFIWMSNSNTIGLYALLDWDTREYVFIDTGIFCSQTGNWSCILYNSQIVIHTEDADAAEQFLYPLPLLREYARPMPPCPPPFTTTEETSKPTGEPFTPVLAARLEAPVRCKRSFIFPERSNLNGTLQDNDDDTPSPRASSSAPPDTDSEPATTNSTSDGLPVATVTTEERVQHDPTPPVPVPVPDDVDGAPPDVQMHPDNPFNWPWYPDSCHFVRQWWPALPAGSRMRRVSCTVVLLASHDGVTHQTRYVLAQHYFGTPLGRDGAVPLLEAPPPKDPLKITNGAAEINGVRINGTHSSDDESEEEPCTPTLNKGKSRETAFDSVEDPDGIPMRMWYIRQPFEVVCVADPPPPGLGANAHEEELEKERPLMAVDFGHAVWLEYVDDDEPAPVPSGAPPVDGANGAPNDDADPSDDESSLYSFNTDYEFYVEDGGLRFEVLEPGARDRVRPKRLRFVSFPTIVVGEDGNEMYAPDRPDYGTVRTLAVPPELNLDMVDTVNIDQSQGAIILSVREGRIFVLYYD